MNRSRMAGRLAAVLLMTTCLTPLVMGAAVPALADGGAGGNSGGVGGSGGSDTVSGTGGSGGTGGSEAGGGGGGAGDGGGNGGQGNGITGGTGGLGGSSGGGSGGPGAGGDGGGGGGGGAHRTVTSTLANSVTLLGGAGGNGGASSADSAGGGGGGGGYGAVVSGTGSNSNSGSITGGSGGVGGTSDNTGDFGGNGGGGGVGVRFTAGGSFTSSASGTIGGGAGGAGGAGTGTPSGSGGNGGAGGAGIVGTGLTVVSGSAISGGAGGAGGASISTGGNGAAGGAGISGSNLNITNAGSITGGAGGAAGTGATPGTAGLGGAGIVASTATITNSGTISGGAGGAPAFGGFGIVGSNLTIINSGTIQGLAVEAIVFNGGTNVLELRAGSIINGAVLNGALGNNTLRLGGSTNSSFDTSVLGGGFNAFNAFEKTGGSAWTLTGQPVSGQATPWTISQGTLAISSDNNLGTANETLTFNGGTLQLAPGFTGGMTRPIVLNAAGGTIDTGINALAISGVISGSGGLVKTGTGTLTLTGNNAYSGGTTVSGGVLIGNTASLQGNILNNAAVVFNQIASGTYAGNMSGTGGFTKLGSGTLALTGTNSYSGGTTVSDGVLIGNTASLQGNITNNAAVVFNQTGSGTYAGNMSGSGIMTLQGGGTLILTGTNTYTAGTSVLGGTLVVNGSLTSPITLFSGSMLGGSGTTGTVVAIGATLVPGNSIGTLTVNGNFAQLGGVYQVEANAAGQSDRINVSGTATISNGATVQALAQPGNYGRSTTYTILRANGGVSGTYSGVSSNFAFLTPSLSYDANDVFLTLSMAENAFSFGGRTYNQRQVGRTLDQTFNGASGDYATVLNAIAGLSTTQGPQTLDAISGQNYAGFGNAMVQGAQLFLSNFANRAGSRSGGGTRVALAEACDVACDATTPALWGAWGGAVGGTGTIAGNDNAGTFTYSVGGFSGGLDRRFGDNFLAGITVGYQTGGQWTGGFDGRSVTDSVQAGLYASFLQGPLYVDAVAAYAYSNNQLWRPINIAGLQPRTAYGQAGANQFLGQIEAGWRFDLGGAAGYFIAPFALLQGSVATQNGLTETGAQSLNLSVAQQTTSSLRTIFGAQVGAAMDVGLRDRIAAQLRFGWSHEYSDTARPVTASFAGAPSVPFTVFGAAPTRDGAVIGFSASTAIAEAMGVYVRYEGTIAGQDSSHALTAGLRMTW